MYFKIPKKHIIYYNLFILIYLILGFLYPIPALTTPPMLLIVSGIYIKLSIAGLRNYYFIDKEILYILEGREKYQIPISNISHIVITHIFGAAASPKGGYSISYTICTLQNNRISICKGYKNYLNETIIDCLSSTYQIPVKKTIE